MVAKRIIPCLDVHEGKTVKGVNFVNLQEVGNPVELGRYYSQQGADELVYLDISATNEGRGIFRKLVKEVALTLNIPFTVGGGIKSLEDASAMLESGADKVSLNSSAIGNPAIIDQISKAYGSQFVVVAIDASFVNGKWRIFTNGGKRESQRELFEWAKEAMERGAGEILFTSMDKDGTKSGFEYDTLKKLNQVLGIPLIASGGAGTVEHFTELFKDECADAALAASVFHRKEIMIGNLKQYLRNNGINVRL
jgi:cyclase